MKDFKFVIIIFVFLGLTLNNTTAQGFSTLIKKIDKLEARLNSISASQVSYKNKLKDNLSKLNELGDYSDLNSKIIDVTKRLAILQKDLKGLNEYVRNSKKTDKIQPFIDDLTNLTSELKKIIGDKSSLGTDDVNSSDKKSTAQAIEITGFVDASYFFNGNTSENTFGLDQVEIDIKKTFSEKSFLRADIDWVNDGAGGFIPDVEQGFLVYSYFTIGKFNAPIGFELLDPTDMYQFSHALVFNYGLPTNLTGLMFSSEIGNNFNLNLYVTNGWDQNFDINKGKTFGGRLGYSNDKYGIGLSAIRGEEAGPVGDYLTVFDIDLTATPIDNLLLGGEINIGSDDAGASPSDWFGILLMAQYKFTKLLGLTGRYDYFDDKGASRLGSGIAEKRQAITIAPTFALENGMNALLEVRVDFSDKKVFTDKNGDPKKSTLGAAFEVTYSF